MSAFVRPEIDHDGLPLDRVDDLRHSDAGLVDQDRALLDPLDARGGEGLDLLGGFGRSLRQAAHFACHDGKAPACSPARAAYTAALSARMFVWKAIPSITLMMSAICLELSLMPFIVSTTLPTTVPHLTATIEAP